jgi:hypothetical protein
MTDVEMIAKLEQLADMVKVRERDWQRRLDRANAENAQLRTALIDLLGTCGHHVEDTLDRDDAPAEYLAIDNARTALSVLVRKP